jgi:hypothetical protein
VVEADSEEELNEIFRKHDIANGHVRIRERKGDKPVYEGICAAGHMWHRDTAEERDAEAKSHEHH